MANTNIASLAPMIIAKAHKVLRKRLAILTNVNKDYAMIPKGKDETIPVSVPTDFGTAGNASAAAYFDPPDHTNVTRNLALTSWKEKGFYLTDQEIAKIATEVGYVPNQLEAAAEAIARAIAADGWATYKGVYGLVGSAGTTPFGSTTDVAVDAGSLLDDQFCPTEDRTLLVNSAAKANVLKLDAFKSFDKRGDLSPLRDANMGRFLGLDWFLDQAVPLHTRGTLAGTPLVNGAVAIGATTMNIDAGALTGTVVPGDIFTVAGDPQQYVATNTTTAAANAITGITFSPASVLGFADNAAVTFVATHRVNLAFNKNAIYFGSRILAGDDTGLLGNVGNAIFEEKMEDPVTGVVLRLSVTRQKYRVVWNLDCLYGWLLARPELAVRVAGAST